MKENKGELSPEAQEAIRKFAKKVDMEYILDESYKGEAKKASPENIDLRIKLYDNSQEKKSVSKQIPKEEYKEIKNYEEPTKGVKQGKNWKPFKVGLCLLLLSGALALGKTAYDKVDEYLTEEETGVLGDDITFETANDEQKEIAQKRIDSIKENSGYEFENLSKEELLDAVSRITPVENKMHLIVYQSHFFDMGQDQVLLEKILKKTYGEEFKTYSEEKIRDLKKLAYELLGEDKEKQEYVRDPERVRAAEEKQKEKLNATKDEREIGE